MAKQQPKDESTTAIVETPKGDLEVPEFLRDSTSTRGTERIDAEHMAMPRIALCQSNTPQRKVGNPLFIRGLEEGQFFNTLSRAIYGPKIHFIPLFFYPSRIMFKDIDLGGGLLCQAPDGIKCQLNNGGPCLHQAWGPEGQPPECTELYNFASLVESFEGQFDFGIVSLKSTHIKAAKDLNSRIRLKKKDTFAFRYVLESFPDRKHNQDFFNVRADEAGWVTIEQFRFAESQFEALIPKIKSGEASFDVAGLADEQSNEQFAARDAESSEL